MLYSSFESMPLHAFLLQPCCSVIDPGLQPPEGKVNQSTFLGQSLSRKVETIQDRIQKHQCGQCTCCCETQRVSDSVKINKTWRKTAIMHPLQPSLLFLNKLTSSWPDLPFYCMHYAILVNKRIFQNVLKVMCDKMCLPPQSVVIQLVYILTEHAKQWA